MARVTVEDCVVKVPNRFEVVMLAAQRARNISAGARLTINRDNDKNPVVALREIADETVSLEALGDGLVQSFSVMLKWTIQTTNSTSPPQAELNGEVGPANALEERHEDVLSLDDGDGDALSDTPATC